MTAAENVLIERADYGALVTVNRPKALNALDERLLRRLGEVVGDLSADEGVAVVIITGAGDRAFVAGADIAEMNACSRDELAEIVRLGQALTRAVELAPKPVIAMVNGYALGGGCELALACDLVVAAETARFGLPEVKLGLLPGFGGTQRLPRRIGWGRARDLILTGRQVPADEALRLGLCDRVVPTADLRSTTEALAVELAAVDAGALAAAKEALRLAADEPLALGLAREAELFVELFDRPERAAAMERFLRRSG